MKLLFMEHYDTLDKSAANKTIPMYDTNRKQTPNDNLSKQNTHRKPKTGCVSRLIPYKPNQA